MRSRIPEGYDNIDFRFTDTRIPLLVEKPEGYRWADEVEADFWWHIRGAVNVLRGSDVEGGTQTSLAVPK